jgi:ADP-ribosylglycohydrolase
MDRDAIVVAADLCERALRSADQAMDERRDRLSRRIPAFHMRMAAEYSHRAFRLAREGDQS